MPDSEIQTDENKQHFDDIYIAKSPVPFKERIIDALDYISDDFNRAAFDRLILPWSAGLGETRPLKLVDLCCCFGNTTLAVAHGMTVNDIRANWADEASCRRVAKPRRLSLETTGIDISGNALAYAKKAGIFDRTIEANLNAPEADGFKAAEAALREADIVISTASLVYLEPDSIRRLVAAFASGETPGRMLVNFLNPFALEKADETKRALLAELSFVGSNATRHRRLSQLEQENYPGEAWALLEIWGLERARAAAG